MKEFIYYPPNGISSALEQLGKQRDPWTIEDSARRLGLLNTPRFVPKGKIQILIPEGAVYDIDNCDIM